ncbi:N-acetylneuraminate synthase family protein [Pseudomonadales bacterium]|nr:N-acetylneuraminate synthase family protein [Pseudomonadales bacterium]
MIKNGFSVGQKKVGHEEPCYVIAEIGSNHNQDFELACEHIEAAAKSGADAVKFQTFKASSHYSTKSPGFSYLDKQDTHKLIKSLELNRSWQKDLMNKAIACGVDFFSSPCDSDAINSLVEIDTPIYKVASFDLPDLELIAEIASHNKPIILSTGMATWQDIQLAVDAAANVGNTDVALLQCTSLYPAPVGLSNLSAIKSMKDTFGLPVGYSDHTEGDHVSLAAISMGACILEKHFTLDKKLPGPDHSFAMEPKAWREMVSKIRDIEAAIGDGLKNGPRPDEYEMAEKGRRSVHASVDIKKGDVITREMLSIKRPGLGVSPHFINQIVGRKAMVDIDEDAWIVWDYV